MNQLHSLKELRAKQLQITQIIKQLHSLKELCI
jgi:hypothetical protein